MQSDVSIANIQKQEVMNYPADVCCVGTRISSRVSFPQDLISLKTVNSWLDAFSCHNALLYFVCELLCLFELK